VLRQEGETSGRNRIYHFYREKELTVGMRRAHPRSSLGYATLAEYAASLTATGDRLRNPGLLR